jgi:hypothetical protein
MSLAAHKTLIVSLDHDDSRDYASMQNPSLKCTFPTRFRVRRVL